jgi:Fe-S-cluster containining protein
MPVSITKTSKKISTSPLGVSETARPVLGRIIGQLKALETLTVSSPLDETFLCRWRRVLDDIDIFQQQMIAGSDYSVTCTRGCATCCYHWVEDVNSFEAEIIADKIRRMFPHRVGEILRGCRDDCEELERLDVLVQNRLEEHDVRQSSGPAIDPVDLLLHVFYRLGRPCPLLDAEGCCMVYDERPLTCRMYLSFSDPIRCDPEYITTSSTSTFLVDLSESANTILDRLHFAHMRFEGDTGLRSLLARYLA